MVVAPESLSSLNAEQLRELARDLIAQVARQDAQITHSDHQIYQLDHQIVDFAYKRSQHFGPILSHWFKDKLAC